MNLKELDLFALATLWTAAAQRNPLIEIPLRNELQSRIATNKNFSREYLFELGSIKRCVLTVEFIPTSDAFNRYGANVTIKVVIDGAELLELTKNYIAKPVVNTTGVMKGKILVNDNLSQRQVEELEPISFHTRDILRVLHL